MNHSESMLPQDLANLASSSIPVGVDVSVIAALKVAESKRPLLQRHSLGIAGALSAASGSMEGPSTDSILKRSVSSVSTNLLSRTFASESPVLPGSVSPAGSQFSGMSDTESLGMSPTYSFGAGVSNAQSSRSRRKRAAAAEQGRILKKLKTKGHLVE